MKNFKIYVVGSGTYYTAFIHDCELVDNIEDADIVLFTGGEDVDPILYGKEQHSTTRCNIRRDRTEQQIFSKIKPNQLALGICRGSQFLCVMNGGWLVQHCNNHAILGTHEIINEATGEIFNITSTHHQMQYPYNLDSEYYTVLYKSKDIRSNIHEGDGIVEQIIKANGEPEIVLYHKPGFPKCLAIQGHPEMIPNSSVSKMINELLKSLI